MLFSYVVIKKEVVRSISISMIEEPIYRFISPLCDVWFILATFRERVPAPWGPISSLHPRSIVREERNREETKEESIVPL